MHRLLFLPALLAGSVVAAANAAQPPGLLDVYALAVEEDPRISIAELQVDIGEARKDAARGALLPQASFSGQWSENELEFVERADPAQEYPGERLLFQVRQLIFNWSAFSANNRARRELNQREMELMDAMDQLSVDVAQRYFDILLADDDVDLLQSELESVRKQLDEMKARYERELAPVTEYLEARARADQVQADLIDAENRAALAREELAVLTGRRLEAVAPLRASVDLPELGRSMDSWVEAAMQDNAQLAGRREAIAAARRGVEEARGAHLPTVNFVASAQRSDVGFDNLQSPERDVLYLGLDVNMPLFTGGANSARLREAWSQYYVAREEEEGARREVLKRVRGAWLNAKASRRRLDAASLTVESATTAHEAISKALQLGSAKTADVLEALARRIRAERDYREALYGYLFNWLSVKREGGALNPEDLWRLDESVLAAPASPGPPGDAGGAP